MKLKPMNLRIMVRSFILILALAAVALALPAKKRPPEDTTVTVTVKDRETEKPIKNAQLTLRFKDSGKGVFKRSKRRSWTGKTNSRGFYRFKFVRQGQLVLFVTAEHYQSFGEEYEIYQDEASIEVGMKKPKPLL